MSSVVEQAELDALGAFSRTAKVGALPSQWRPAERAARQTSITDQRPERGADRRPSDSARTAPARATTPPAARSGSEPKLHSCSAYAGGARAGLLAVRRWRCRRRRRRPLAAQGEQAPVEVSMPRAISPAGQLGRLEGRRHSCGSGTSSPTGVAVRRTRAGGPHGWPRDPPRRCGRRRTGTEPFSPYSSPWKIMGVKGDRRVTNAASGPKLSTGSRSPKARFPT
jgi:hypothetical protein